MKPMIVVAALTLGLAPFAHGQAVPQPRCVKDGIEMPPSACGLPTPPEDPFARYLFPPELVMAHQQAINLTERQRTAIKDAMVAAQSAMIQSQFRMSTEVETLQRLLQGVSLDEKKVLEQVDRVLAVEREIKWAQLTLMIRIKNQLTAEQQTALSRLRR